MEAKISMASLLVHSPFYIVLSITMVKEERDIAENREFHHILEKEHKQK